MYTTQTDNTEQYINWHVEYRVQIEILVFVDKLWRSSVPKLSLSLYTLALAVPPVRNANERVGGRMRLRRKESQNFPPNRIVTRLSQVPTLPLSAKQTRKCKFSIKRIIADYSISECQIEQSLPFLCRIVVVFFRP